MEVFNWVETAYERIAPYIRKTPLEFSPAFSELCGCKVYLKLENLQITGSFKARGGLNKILSLTDAQKAKGVVTASTGNHAAAVAHALELAEVSGIIYMPENVSETKIANLKRYDRVELRFVGQDSVDSELAALAFSKESGLTFVSPYNDPEVIGGQGTIGKEMLQDLPDVDAVLVPVGGGGLISGIAGYVKHGRSTIDVVGCQPENSAVMYHSILAGEILDMASSPTVSDGTAGGIEQGSITFDICQQYVDTYHLITEDEIMRALLLLMKHHYYMVEGAAGLTLAALIKNKAQYKDKTVALVVCGNKMSLPLLKRVIALDQED
jgi:threonine dehydratase